MVWVDVGQTKSIETRGAAMIHVSKSCILVVPLLFVSLIKPTWLWDVTILDPNHRQFGKLSLCDKALLQLSCL